MSDPREPLEGGNGDVLDDDIGEDAGGDQEVDAEEPDGEGEEVEGQGQQEEVAEPPSRTRARDTISALRRRAQTAEHGLEDLQRQVAELRTAQTRPPVDPAAAAAREAEEERRARDTMTPDQYFDWMRQRDQQRFQNQLLASEIRQMDRQDASDYRSFAASNPAASRLTQRVEQQIQQLRAQGIYTIGRMDVFYREFGREMSERAGRAVTQQRRTGQQQRQRQTVNPPNARGDVARGGVNRQDRDDEAALRGITMGDL